MKQTNLSFLMSLPLFKMLDKNEVQIVDQYLDILELNAGDILFNEGDSGDYICFVISGQLDIIKESLAGKPTVIASLVTGQCIGEMSIIDNLPRSATVKANTDTVLTILSRDDFNRLLQDEPYTGIKIIQHLARTLSLGLRRVSNNMADGLFESVVNK